MQFTKLTKKLVETVSALALAGVVALVAGCSGSGSDSKPAPSPPNPGAQNQVTMTVNSGVAQFVNIPTVSVTVCAPGTTVCQTVNNIQVDTGSFGLRLIPAAAAQVARSLPQVTTGGQPLVECAQFVTGSTFGTVRTADVKIAGEVASSVPIQMIGDVSSSVTPPAGCPVLTQNVTAQDLGANGILGIGAAAQDCGTACSTPAGSNSMYVVCSSSNCTSVGVPLAQQVANPVQFFPVDNNGVIIAMQTLSFGSASSATGTLTFGIGTQTNNTLASSATVLNVDPFGNLLATYKGTPLVGFFDTGSNAYFFDDPTNAFAPCVGNFVGFYCQPGSVAMPAVSVSSFPISGSANNNATKTFNISVANAMTLFASNSNFAFNSLAGPAADTSEPSFDLGLPFFYGRTVFMGLVTPNASPFVAF